MKTCVHCHKDKPESEFYRKGSTLQAWCKDCQKEYGRLRNGTTGVYKKQEECMDKEELIRCKCCGELKPRSEYKMAGQGLMRTCVSCWKNHIIQSRSRRDEIAELKKQIEESRMARLSAFTPRELMLHLKKLGYEGVLTYTEVKSVDITKLG